MNLMFYDFNGSSFSNTGQNFYNNKASLTGPNEHQDSSQPALNNGGVNEPAEIATEVIQSGFRMNFRTEGDRVPTRERGYRSANQNMRRRDLYKKNGRVVQGAPPMSSVNETVTEYQLNEHDMIP